MPQDGMKAAACGGWAPRKAWLVAVVCRAGDRQGKLAFLAMANARLRREATHKAAASMVSELQSLLVLRPSASSTRLAALPRKASTNTGQSSQGRGGPSQGHAVEAARGHGVAPAHELGNWACWPLRRCREGVFGCVCVACKTGRPQTPAMFASPGPPDCDGVWASLCASLLLIAFSCNSVPYRAPCHDLPAALTRYFVSA